MGKSTKVAKKSPKASPKASPKKVAKKSPKVAPKKKKEESSDDDSSDDDDDSSDEEEEPKKPAKKSPKASPKAAPKKAAKKEESSDDDSDDDSSDEEEEAPKKAAKKPSPKASPKASPKKAAKKEESSDDDDSDDDSSDEEEEKPKTRQSPRLAAKREIWDDAEAQPAKKAKTGITRCFVGGLSFDADEDAVREHFKECGEITDLYMPWDNDRGKYKGFCFVTFADTDGCEKACAMNEGEMMGRWLKIEAAEDTRPKRDTPSKGKGGSFTPSEKPEGCKKVFVGNLSWNVDENMMWEFFGAYGTVTFVRIATDRETGQPRGFGHVEFEDTDMCEKAVTEGNGKEMDGRGIRIDYAGDRPGGKDGGKGKGGKGDKGGKGKGKGGKGKGKGGKGKGKGGPPSRASEGVQEFAGTKVSFD